MTDAPQPSPADVAALSFESAQAELEAIVERLENPQTGLDEALALWERGEALHAHCQSKLDYAAERIRRIQLTPDEIAAVAMEGTEGDFTPVPGSAAGAEVDATEGAMAGAHGDADDGGSGLF